MADLCPNCKAGYNASSCKCTSCGAYIISSDANSFDVPREVIEGIKNSYDRSGFPGVFVHNTRLGAGEFPLRLGVSKYYWTGVTGTAGKLLLTDKKLYFSAHRFTYYRPNETFDLSDIEKVEFDSNLLLSHQISVYVKGERHKFVVYRGKEWVDLINTAKKHFAPAAPAIKVATPHKAEPVAPAVPASDANPCGGQPKYVEELRQLKQLLDEGIITKEEFEAKKKKILNL
ncbi:MAG: SHOCT domain-containing protein [Clostridia bacterium]|nr:SHOCT domain-containing protein [Clostridia bacterium]